MRRVYLAAVVAVALTQGCQDASTKRSGTAATSDVGLTVLGPEPRLTVPSGAPSNPEPGARKPMH